MEAQYQARCPACLDDRKMWINNKCYRCYPYQPIYPVFYEEEADDDLVILQSEIAPDISLNSAYTHNSYYGRMDDAQGALGVCYMMLDEHIEKSVAKSGDKFIKKLNDTLEDFRYSLFEKFNELSRTTVALKLDIDELKKKLAELDKKKANIPEPQKPVEDVKVEKKKRAKSKE